MGHRLIEINYKDVDRCVYEALRELWRLDSVSPMSINFKIHPATLLRIKYLLTYRYDERYPVTMLGYPVKEDLDVKLDTIRFEWS